MAWSAIDRASNQLSCVNDTDEWSRIVACVTSATYALRVAN
jgi:hypothetical protein